MTQKQNKTFNVKSELFIKPTLQEPQKAGARLCYEDVGCIADGIEI